MKQLQPKFVDDEKYPLRDAKRYFKEFTGSQPADKRESATTAQGVWPSVGSKLIAVAPVACFLAIVTVFLFHTLYLNGVAEDAFITFRFARHLADGHGIVWNIGETPVEGYTNFLWLLLSALLLKLGLEITLFSQLFGVLASLVTMIYVYRFARSFFNLPAGYALIPCLFLAFSGPFAAWAGSGLETNLFGMFLLIGCYYFAGWVRFDSARNLVLSCLALLLATLTRPEGFMVFGLLAALGLVFSTGRLNTMARYGLVLLVYVVPFLIYFLWRYNYFGFLLPNTFYAKTGGGIFQYLRGAKYTGLFAFHFILPLAPILLVLVWERGLAGVKPALNGPALIFHLRKHLGGYICGLLIGVYTLYIVYVGGDYMAMYRFFVPLLPFIYLLVGPVAAQLLSGVASSGRKRVLAAGLVGCAVLLTALQSTPVETRLFRKPEFMHGTYQGVQFERWNVTRYKLIADFFKQYKRTDQESLVLEPIGVIPYYAEMTTHSIHAIVDAHIAHEQIPGQVLGTGFPGHEKKDLAYALSKKPTYFVFSKHLRPEPQPYPDYWEEIDPIVRERYQLKSVWLDDTVNDESGYFTFLELKRATVQK